MKVRVVRSAVSIAMSGIAVAIIATPVRAFDCAAARSEVERAICSDPRTKAADDAMDDAFKRLKGRLSPEQAEALLTDQRRWLRSRMDAEAVGSTEEGCSGDKKRLSTCLRRRDEARTAALEARALAGSGSSARGLVPYFVERPLTKQTYDVRMLLYRFPEPRGAMQVAFDADVDAIIADASWDRGTDDQIGDDYLFHAASSIAYASDRLLSVEMSTLYWGGGPHPDTGGSTINIDVERGRDVGFDDLADEAGRRTVGEACIAQMRKDARVAGQEADAEEMYGVTGATRDAVRLMANWTFGAKSAVVRLGRLMGFGLGEFSCTLPYAVLRPLAKATFPLP